MACELQKRGFAVGRHRARSLMREAGVECQQRRRRRSCSTTDSQHRQPVAPNVLRRQFQVEAPNDVWVADITALWTFEGWLYLAAIMDLYDHQLIGYALSDSMPVALPLEALEMAVRHRRPGPGLIHHSDQGSQYASTAYQSRMDELGFIPSMSRKGNCWDNAVMERFFGSLKSEWTDARVYTTREAARLDVFDLTRTLQAGSMGEGGDVFVLDMGEPVRIFDLARRMIRLTGYEVRDEANPHGDIEITFSGLRPGEKLYEELLLGEAVEETDHPMICRAQEAAFPWSELQAKLDELDAACQAFDCVAVRQILAWGVSGFGKEGPIVDWLWQHQRQPAKEADNRPLLH